MDREVPESLECSMQCLNYVAEVAKATIKTKLILNSLYRLLFTRRELGWRWENEK